MLSAMVGALQSGNQEIGGNPGINSLAPGWLMVPSHLTFLPHEIHQGTRRTSPHRHSRHFGPLPRGNGWPRDSTESLAGGISCSSPNWFQHKGILVRRYQQTCNPVMLPKQRTRRRPRDFWLCLHWHLWQRGDPRSRGWPSSHSAWDLLVSVFFLPCNIIPTGPLQKNNTCPDVKRKSTIVQEERQNRVPSDPGRKQQPLLALKLF